jgi:multiple sugar transport system permease protein
MTVQATQFNTGKPKISPHARRGGLKAGDNRFGAMLLIPALFAFGAVVVYPFLKALSLSLYRVTLTSRDADFVGLSNFRRILVDPAVHSAFVTTATYVTLTTIVTIVLGLTWAMILNQPFRGRSVLRAASLLPWIMPSVVTAFLWGWIFNARFGLLNYLALEAGFIDFPIAWLSTSTGAMTAIIMTKVWLSIPVFMAFFLAGLQNLDREEIEAARVDGAGNWAVFRNHILPHLRPVLLVVVVLGVIGNLQHFDTIYAMTGGGPVRATTVLSIEVFRRPFEQWDIGMAATVGVLWVATILPPAFFYLKQLMKGAD